MKTLAEQIANTCTHFNGMSNKTCKVGVVYDSVADESKKGFARFPCWKEGESVPCEKRRFLTPIEVEAEVAEHDRHWEQLKLAMGATHRGAKARGYGKGCGGRGAVECPCCGGTLSYSVAGYNGHLHGHCSTKGCASWME